MNCRPTCAARRNENAECVCAEVAEMRARWMHLDRLQSARGVLFPAEKIEHARLGRVLDRLGS